MIAHISLGNVEVNGADKMTHHPYAQLIDIKRWADDGLYKAAERSFDQLSKQDTGLMLRVFDHIHTVDKIFQCHLQGLLHDFQSARSETPPEFEALANSAKEVDDWYAVYVRGLTANDFEQVLEFSFTSGKPARMTRGQIILHVCLHGTYHRGNAGALLQLRGITPSRDAITDFLEEAA
jgi:uncharacterized damage-inducible protein DinB